MSGGHESVLHYYVLTIMYLSTVILVHKVFSPHPDHTDMAVENKQM